MSWKPWKKGWHARKLIRVSKTCHWSYDFQKNIFFYLLILFFNCCSSVIIIVLFDYNILYSKKANILCIWYYTSTLMIDGQVTRYAHIGNSTPTFGFWFHIIMMLDTESNQKVLILSLYNEAICVLHSLETSKLAIKQSFSRLLIILDR